MAKQHIRMEEKPLSEVIGKRRKHYQTKVEKAFDSVYNSGDFEYIGRFEGLVTKLSDVVIKRGNLDGLVQSTGKALPTGDRRPRLTSYQYAKARDAGMTNEDIKKKFRMDSPHQISGFGRQYATRKKAKK